jgi:hypothetical protein
MPAKMVQMDLRQTSIILTGRAFQRASPLFYTATPGIASEDEVVQADLRYTGFTVQFHWRLYES